MLLHSNYGSFFLPGSLKKFRCQIYISLAALQPKVILQVTHDSWSRLTGPDSRPGHHIAEQKGYSGPSHTGIALDDMYTTLNGGAEKKNVIKLVSE